MLLAALAFIMDQINGHVSSRKKFKPLVRENFKDLVLLFNPEKNLLTECLCFSEAFDYLFASAGVLPTERTLLLPF